MEARKSFVHEGRHYRAGDKVETSPEMSAQLERAGLVGEGPGPGVKRDPLTGSFADVSAIEAARKRDDAAAGQPGARTGLVDADFAKANRERVDVDVARIAERHDAAAAATRERAPATTQTRERTGRRTATAPERRTQAKE